MRTRLMAAVAVASMLAATGAAQAQIKLGAILSISGPGAAMGVGYKGAFELFPTEIAGQKIEYIIRDDATDASTGYSAAQKMISEDHIDAFIGPSLTATDAAVAPLANQAKVPMLAMAPYEYDPQKQPYTFSDAQPLSLIVAKVFAYMQTHGVKDIGYIGFSDGWGDQVLAATKQNATADNIKILTDERYARTDTTCEAQVLKLISVHPQAVMMGNSATPAALPVVALRHLGYKGTIYGNHGIVSPAFIKVGGAAVNGVIAATSPCRRCRPVAGRQPDQARRGEFRESPTRRNSGPGRRAFRRLQLRRLPAAASSDPAGTEGRQARHRGIPRRAA